MNQPCDRGRPRSCLRQRPARIAGDVHRRLAADRGSRPNGRAVHREYPRGVRIGGIEHDREADVADLLRHRGADAAPAPRGPVDTIDAAVILLIEPVRQRRMHDDAVRIVTEGNIGVRQEIRRDSLVERRPVAPAIGRLEHASDRDPEIQVLRIARIDDHRMQQLAAGRAESGRPLRAHRVIVESGDGLPGVSTVGRTEEPRRRAARVPGAFLGRVTGCQPEDCVDRPGRLALRHLAKRGRLARFLPMTAAIGRAEHRGPEMTRLRPHQQHFGVARILHDVMDHVPQELRSGKRPGSAAHVATERKRAFAGSDPDRHRGHSSAGMPRLFHGRHDELRALARCGRPARGHGLEARVEAHAVGAVHVQRAEQ